MTSREFPAVGPRPDSHALRTARTHRVNAMRRRMPYRMVIIPDPMLEGEAAIQDDEPNATVAILNLLYRAWEEGKAAVVECDVWESSNIARSAGRTPSDEPSHRLNAVIPGRLPGHVEVTDLATIPEEGRQGLYTIINISLDRRGYVTNVGLETFAHRGVSG